MKKFLLSLVCASAAFIGANAVPPGVYYTNRGVQRALVSDNGRTIYVLDRNGNVTHELQVTNEKSDGSFATRDTKTGITHSIYENAWFQENGKIYLNVKWLPETVTRR